MLVHIDIRDLAVVQHLDVSFEDGLTVLTGETGAGKSILLTAFGLALGDRADSTFVRVGASRAEINLAFDLQDSRLAMNWLEEQSLAEGHECLIRRVISVDGRSKAFINGRPVNLASLQALGEALFEVHGQHAHVRLLRPVEQRHLLDESAGNQELLRDVEASYRRWRQLREELESRERSSTDQTARLELLTYQVGELEQRDIGGLDYAALVEEHARQASMGRILEVGQVQMGVLYEHENHSVNARLVQAMHDFGELSSVVPEFSEILELVRESQVQVKEAYSQLRRMIDHLDVNPELLDTLDRRLADVHRLARKHRVKPEELPGLVESLRIELAGINQGAGSLESIREAFVQAVDEYRMLAERLSGRRKAAAIRMQDAISGAMQELGMSQGRLCIDVQTDTDREPSAHGLDTVEFLVSANAGMVPRPLARVASGGELSRISLAIQVAAMSSRPVSTLVFDEVDTGIGGAIAEIVGQKLRLLGDDRQVFCVTHLAQVAAQGHHHLLVRKTIQDGVSQSSVAGISGEDRTNEIARMLGGVRITEQALAHAGEMLQSASLASSRRSRAVVGSPGGVS